MGCAQSKIDNEETVVRSKDRRNLMKDAVSARNAFASGHSGYSFALKNIGAALSDFAHGEAEDNQEHHEQPVEPTPPPPPPPPSSLDHLPPPPPPLPNFSPSPIKRAVSLPTISKNKKHALEFDNVTITEDEEEEEDDEDEENENDNDNDDEGEEDDESISEKNTNKSKNKNKIGGSHGDRASASTSSPRTPETRPMPNTAWDYFFMVDDHLAGPSLNNTEEEEPHINNASTMEENVENVNLKVNAIHNNNINSNSNVISKNVDNFMKNDGDINVSEPERAEGKVVIEHASTAPPEFGGSRRAIATVSLMQVLNQIDDHFLKGSQSAKDVSNMLEANRLHYHSNFADNRAIIDHSARVMRVITWNRSFRGLGLPPAEGGRDDVDLEDNETLAIVLDKMLAWEKKLFEEVKRAELMKLEYQRKVAVLNKLKKRGATNEMLEKTKAAVAHLHTKYVVDMQTMDSSVSEVNRLRDEELYPKLVALVDGMAKMWENMCIHHNSQLSIVSELKPLEVAHAIKETTQHHHERTEELFKIAQQWHMEFEKFVNHQKQFIQALNSWLKLNLIPIESSLKEKVTSPPRAPNPPIQTLLRAWHDYLEKLPDELAKSAISSFTAVIKTIMLHQEEEMKLKEKCEETRKELLRKKQAYEEWHRKYKKSHSDESEAERGDDANAKDPVLDRQIVVESLRKRLEEEMEEHRRHSLQVREKSLGSLKLRLPDIFRAMSDFAHASLDAYGRLRSITQPHNSNGGSSC